MRRAHQRQQSQRGAGADGELLYPCELHRPAPSEHDGSEHEQPPRRPRAALPVRCPEESTRYSAGREEWTRRRAFRSAGRARRRPRRAARPTWPGMSRSRLREHLARRSARRAIRPRRRVRRSASVCRIRARRRRRSPASAPTNQTSVLSFVVPVFPAIGTLSGRKRRTAVAVPRSTTSRIMSRTMKARTGRSAPAAACADACDHTRFSGRVFDAIHEARLTGVPRFAKAVYAATKSSGCTADAPIALAG